MNARTIVPSRRQADAVADGSGEFDRLQPNREALDLSARPAARANRRHDHASVDRSACRSGRSAGPFRCSGGARSAASRLRCSCCSRRHRQSLVRRSGRALVRRLVSTAGVSISARHVRAGQPCGVPKLWPRWMHGAHANCSRTTWWRGSSTGYGPQARALLGPKIATTGVPTAVATWTTPPSLATTSRQRLTSAPSDCGLGAAGAIARRRADLCGDLARQRLFVVGHTAQHDGCEPMSLEKRHGRRRQSAPAPNAARG